jgi:hypothetical protein
MLETRDAVQRLVERAVATPDEQMVVAVAYRLLGGLHGVPFRRGDDNVQ